MRPSFRPAAVALVIVAALSVSACAPPAPAEPPKASPSSTALFASDEEALAAAEEAYREYQHVSDAIYIDGGADPERLLEIATQAKYEYEKSGYDKIRALGYHSTGGSTFDGARLWDRADRRRLETLLVEAKLPNLRLEVMQRDLGVHHDDGLASGLEHPQGFTNEFL